MRLLPALPRSVFRSICGLSCFTVLLQADPLTKQQEIDFSREVPSRNLKGLAVRSDGRVLAGPVFTDLEGPRIGDILWVIKATTPNHFLVGTGPEGKVQEITLRPDGKSYQVRLVADVEESQALAILPLPDDKLLVGTSPTGAVYLFQKGQAVARVPLAVDSIFDFLPLPDGSVLVGTGNPGKIYRLDVAKLTQAGVITGPAKENLPPALTLFGEIRDRNVRRLARLTDGRIIAGSSPKGNLYAFTPAVAGNATDPLILQENHDTEVVDILPIEEGGFYAALVATPGDIPRLAKPPEPNPKEKESKEIKEEPARLAFTGRSSVLRFPADGFPEPIVAKGNLALYRLLYYQDWLLMSGGEQGDLLGYDPVSRRSLVFPGSTSAQLNDFVALDRGRFLALRNNAPGLALISFVETGPREFESKKIDLGLPSELGALRFARLRGLTANDLHLEVRTSLGSDDLEGWSPWRELRAQEDGYQADHLRGRYLRYRLQVKGTATDFQIDKPTLYSLPQNRRPSLADFRIFSPNLALVAAPEPPAAVTATLGQLLFPGPRDNKDDGTEKRKGALMGSQVIPQIGAQLVYWSVNDPDGDDLAYTFSIRTEQSSEWTDLTVNSRENYLQFDTSSLAEGLYFTRLKASEQAPRPEAQRLAYTFETDSLLVDRTPPTITSATAERSPGVLRLTVAASDRLSLLEGAEFILNNGTREQVTHPLDGIRDGRSESFATDIPEARAAGASSVEILLYDQSGNSVATRLTIK